MGTPAPPPAAVFARAFLLTLAVAVAATQAALAWQHGFAATAANLRHLTQEVASIGAIREHAPDEYDAFLQWVDANTRANATLLLLQPAPHADAFRYFRLSYRVYPRAVWWGDAQARQPFPDWHLPIDPATVLQSPLLAQRHIDALVVDGIAAPALNLPSAIPMRWYDQRLNQYLVDVRAEAH